MFNYLLIVYSNLGPFFLEQFFFNYKILTKKNPTQKNKLYKKEKEISPVNGLNFTEL